MDLKKLNVNERAALKEKLELLEEADKQDKRAATIKNQAANLKKADAWIKTHPFIMEGYVEIDLILTPQLDIGDSTITYETNVDVVDGPLEAFEVEEQISQHLESFGAKELDISWTEMEGKDIEKFFTSLAKRAAAMPVIEITAKISTTIKDYDPTIKVVVTSSLSKNRTKAIRKTIEAMCWDICDIPYYLCDVSDSVFDREFYFEEVADQFDLVEAARDQFLEKHDAT